jgi:D-alanyl-D-alanine dipeptidase
MRRDRFAVLLLALSACADHQPPAQHDTAHAAADSVRPAAAPIPSPAPTPVSASTPPTPLVDAATVASPLIVDMRYRRADNFTGAPLPGYEANRCFLRPEVAAALTKAAHAASDKQLRLLAWDCWRPVRATTGMVDWTTRVHHPELLGVYIGAKSMHNQGVAIDLTLAGTDSVPLTMGTPFDEFSTRAHTMSAAGDTLANRLLLRTLMQSAGFSPYDNEWWHFFIPVPGRVALDGVIRP